MVEQITGRILGSENLGSYKYSIIALDDDSTRPLTQSVAVDSDGRFNLPLRRTPVGSVQLIVTDKSGLKTTISLGGELPSEMVTIVLPDPPQDPRIHVDTMAARIKFEGEARATARTLVSAELENKNVENQKIQSIVNRVLTQLAEHGGGDLRWKVIGQNTIKSLTASAIEDSFAVLTKSAPRVAANPGAVTDGEELSTQELVKRLAGGRTARDGYWRIDPLKTIRAENTHADPDGLPKSQRSGGVGGRSAERRNLTLEPSDDIDTEATIDNKVFKLIEAIRLPEDPPLLVADDPVIRSGADVEFARGVADVTAFHDIHELVLAMPNIWADVFDRRFVEILHTAVRALAAAGADVETLTAPVSADVNPAEHVLARIKVLREVFETTEARNIRPALSATSIPAVGAIRSGITNARGFVLRRETNGEPEPDINVDRRGGFPAFEKPPPDRGMSLPPNDSLPSLLRELEGYLQGKHAFTIFAADGAERAINFGTLLTWRQLWQPMNYQAGEIVDTLTLAPGEERTITTKRRRLRKRYTAEAEKSQSNRSFETTDTMRAESEILRKANATTNFHLTSEGSTKLLVSDGSFTTAATRDVGREGNDTRRRFREAVVKAAQDYGQEHTMEVKTEVEDVLEEESSAKFRNPNDEIVLNAVFYSLQRRYNINEHLYRARPVVLVAMPVPDPAEITSAWLIRYAWIIRRVLLANRFSVALEYLTSSFLGDQEVLTDLSGSVNEHRKALKEARYRLAEARALVEARGQVLRDARARASSGDTDGLFEALEESGIPVVDTIAGHFNNVLGFVGGLFGGGDDKAEERERVALVLEAAEDELLRAERQSREAETQVTAAASALQQATRDYVQAKRSARNHEVRIAELRVHVSDNILHYMQAIWASTPPDQLFFELHNVEVPVLDASVRVSREGVFDNPGIRGITPEEFRADFVSTQGAVEFRSLAEVARLEPLGFKGNMAIFEMYTGNALTDMILAPYLDEHEVLRDPQDLAANWTLTELREYADLLRDRVATGEINASEFDEVHAPFLKATLKQLLEAPGTSEEVVIVPANSVFAELLVTGDSLLEPFKREHRSIDVNEARAEVRERELENLRLAARLIVDQLEDPNIEAKYVFEGDGTATIVPPSGRREPEPNEPDA